MTRVFALVLAVALGACASTSPADDDANAVPATASGDELQRDRPETAEATLIPRGAPPIMEVETADHAPELVDPSLSTTRAPERYSVQLKTSKGDIVIEVVRSWAPNGADRFYNLVKAGFYNQTAFFRVIPNFMAQFGIHGDPVVSAAWRPAQIQDDPVLQSNTRGMVTFAMAGPNTRTTQLFINYRDNSRLDPMGFPPFGRVTKGMAIVDALYGGYGEGAPRGQGPHQGKLQALGNAYLRAEFPKLDYIVSATVLP